MRHQKGVMFACLYPFLFSAMASAQTTLPIRSRILDVKTTIEKKHYSPVPVNDSFSVRLFNTFISRLNEDTTYLSSKDMQAVLPYRLQLDDELNGNGWQFLDKVSGLYKTRLLSADSLVKGKPHQQARHRAILRILDHPSGFADYISDLYCDALASCFDPHTKYMSNAEKEQFNAELSTQGNFFGFTLQKNDSDAIEIAKVMPGSPAWKTGDLNSGDVIVSVGWEGQQAVELKESAVEELNQVLHVPGNNKLFITVRKANGVEKTTSLSRAKIDNEENNVTGYVLKGSRNVGYIYLPDFYTQDTGADGGSANDVAKAVIKLKKENIEALVLDLRYNGGGSLQEALDMAGIFIDAGPLAMIREKDGHIISLKDPNRGTIYSGPMLVMINGQSASASEILAAVLQDYHRAVIVGSRTFGKGSAQQIFPVDSDPQNGFVKITTNKFYRVTGKTTQYAGVQPDIALPDIFDAYNYHEAALPFALPADSIAANGYYKPLTDLPLNGLSKQSADRIHSLPAFAAIANYTASIIKSPPSNISAPVIPPLTRIFSVSLNSFDAATVGSNPYLSDVNANWQEKISRDIYIEEAYQILNDLITTTPK